MVAETPQSEFEVKAQVQLRHFLERYSHFVSHIEYIIISTTHIFRMYSSSYTGCFWPIMSFPKAMVILVSEGTIN